MTVTVRKTDKANFETKSENHTPLQPYSKLRPKTAGLLRVRYPNTPSTCDAK